MQSKRGHALRCAAVIAQDPCKEMEEKRSAVQCIDNRSFVIRNSNMPFVRSPLHNFLVVGAHGVLGRGPWAIMHKDGDGVVLQVEGGQSLQGEAGQLAVRGRRAGGEDICSMDNH